MHRSQETPRRRNPIVRVLSKCVESRIAILILIGLLQTTSALSQVAPPPEDAQTRPTLDSEAGLVVPRSAGERSQETVMEGDRFEMIAHEHELHFFVTGNVRIFGNNILLTCDRLEGISARSEDEVRAGDRLGGMGRIRSMVAIGNVHVRQEGREAIAGRAEVLPDEGRVILTENPVIRDSQGQVSGERIILYQGLERAVVESGPDQPARIVFPTLPDLGFPRGGREDQEPGDDQE